MDPDGVWRDYSKIVRGTPAFSKDVYEKMKDEPENLRKAVKELRAIILSEISPVIKPFLSWVEKCLEKRIKEQRHD